MKCPACSHDAPEDARFCPQCGMKLVDTVRTGAAASGIAHEPASAPAAVEDALSAEAAEAGAAGAGAAAAGTGAVGAVGAGADLTVTEPAAPTEVLLAKTQVRPRVGEAESDLDTTGTFDSRRFAQVRPGPADTAAQAPLVSPELSGPVRAAAAEPPEEHPTSLGFHAGTTRTRALIVAAMVVLAVVSVFVTWRLELWGGKTLPDVVGETPAVATQTLEKLGFEVSTKDVYTDTGVGTVLATSPQANQRLYAGTQVVLSVGVARTVPELAGLTLEEAQALLSERGLSALRIEYQNSNQQEGTVIQTNPAEGEVVSADQVITLVVAQPYTVPDVVGLSQDEAVSVVERSGLSATVLYVASSASSGVVISTDPAAGTVLDAGGSVTIKVSSPYPATPFSIASYFEAKPQDIASYLDGLGYKLSYGALVDGDAKALYTGGDAQPTLMFTPNVFEAVGGFQIWPVQALANGATIAGVRLEFSQAAASETIGELTPTKDCVARVMNACGLVSTQGATTTSTNAAIEPADLRTQDVTFATSASTCDGLAWMVCVYQKAGQEAQCVVAAVPQDSLEAVLQANNVSLDTYGNSLANYASSVFALGK